MEAPGTDIFFFQGKKTKHTGADVWDRNCVFRELISSRKQKPIDTSTLEIKQGGKTLVFLDVALFPL